MGDALETSFVGLGFTTSSAVWLKHNFTISEGDVSWNVRHIDDWTNSFTGWLKPEYTITVGDPVWGVRGTGRLNHVIPNSSTSYIGQQKWAPFFLFIYNVGAMVDNFLAPASFSREATQSNQPSSTNDWSSHLQSGTNAEALYNQHQSTIFAISQPNLS